MFGIKPIHRIGSQNFKNYWVGTYNAPLGKTAIVTEKSLTQEAALAAAARWVQKGEAEAEHSNRRVYKWQLDPEHPGYFVPVWDRDLGPRIVREPIS